MVRDRTNLKIKEIIKSNKKKKRIIIKNLLEPNENYKETFESKGEAIKKKSIKNQIRKQMKGSKIERRGGRK